MPLPLIFSHIFYAFDTCHCADAFMLPLLRPLRCFDTCRHADATPPAAGYATLLWRHAAPPVIYQRRRFYAVSVYAMMPLLLLPLAAALMPCRYAIDMIRHDTLLAAVDADATYAMMSHSHTQKCVMREYNMPLRASEDATARRLLFTPCRCRFRQRH